MYRTFFVAVSVAVMFLKIGSVERLCKTKIRTKFRDNPCECVYEFLREFCVLHIFVRDESMSWCGLESFAVEEIYSYVYWRNNCIHWL